MFPQLISGAFVFDDKPQCINKYVLGICGTTIYICFEQCKISNATFKTIINSQQELPWELIISDLIPLHAC